MTWFKFRLLNHVLFFPYVNLSHKYSTIFALSTSSGMSALAVIRISGPDAKLVPHCIAGLKNTPIPRLAILRKFQDPETKEVLDKGILLWFPGPKSFTGEDVCELHIHGGTAVKRSLIKALHKLPNFCYAEPGEFTKRAFMHGKLDLTEVEGLADLLHAETEAQQKQALRQMDGSLFKLYVGWTDLIKQALAKIEAYIDFSEDQNLDHQLFSAVTQSVKSLKEKIIVHLNDKRRGQNLRSGVYTAIIGCPNVGKSSLLNFLCQNDVAIVSPIPGTTRDLVEKSINLDGYLVHLSDTAGIRDAHDIVEKEGIRRAYKKFFEANIVLFLVEAKTALELFQDKKPIKDEAIKLLLERELNQSFDEAWFKERHIILILNKIDLLSPFDAKSLRTFTANHELTILTSCTADIGLKKLYTSFSNLVKELCVGPLAEEPTITQERHRKHVEECLNCLNNFLQDESSDAVIMAEYLRQATYQLGKITGKITTDDILNIIFKDFCIGK